MALDWTLGGIGDDGGGSSDVRRSANLVYDFVASNHRWLNRLSGASAHASWDGGIQWRVENFGMWSNCCRPVQVRRPICCCRPQLVDQLKPSVLWARFRPAQRGAPSDPIVALPLYFQKNWHQNSAWLSRFLFLLSSSTHTRPVRHFPSSGWVVGPYIRNLEFAWNKIVQIYMCLIQNKKTMHSM